MITAGRSPERFYNLIGAEDTPDNDVPTILEKYRGVTTFSAKDPRYLSVFEVFRLDPDQYAPHDIVELILKCMLYRAKGTLYDAHVRTVKGIDESAAIRAAIIKLNELERKYPALRVRSENPLISGNEVPPQLTTSVFRDEIAKTLGLHNRSLLLRIATAAIWFDQLVRLVARNVAEKDNGFFFFAELTPENVSISGTTLEFTTRIYERYEEYTEDLENDAVYIKVLFDNSNPFAPVDVLENMRRTITLRRRNGDESSSEPRWSYEFKTASPLGDNVEPGDWVLFPGKKLAKVKEVDQGSLVLEKLWQDEAEEDKDAWTCVYYRNIDYISYYIDVLSAYLYQLFFAGMDANTISEPRSIASLKAQLRANPSLIQNLHTVVGSSIDRHVHQQRGADLQRLIGLYRRLTAFFLVSALPGAKVFFKQRRYQETHPDLITSFFGTWNSIRDDIATCLGVPTGSLIGIDNLPYLERALGKSERFGSGTNVNLRVTHNIRQVLQHRAKASLPIGGNIVHDFARHFHYWLHQALGALRTRQRQ
jgi:hypothetical protein